MLLEDIKERAMNTKDIEEIHNLQGQYILIRKVLFLEEVKQHGEKEKGRDG